MLSSKQMMQKDCCDSATPILYEAYWDSYVTLHETEVVSIHANIPRMKNTIIRSYRLYKKIECDAEYVFVGNVLCQSLKYDSFLDKLVHELVFAFPLWKFRPHETKLNVTLISYHTIFRSICLIIIHKHKSLQAWK